MTDIGPVRTVVLTNIPVPYRIPVLDRLRNLPGLAVSVVFEARTEKDRHWEMDYLRSRDLQLEASSRHSLGRVRFLWSALRALDPQVIVIGGYGATYLTAFAWAVAHARGVVVHTDGTLESERRLGPRHRVVRRIVTRWARSYVVTGDGGRALHRSYGVADDRIFESPLAVDNRRFREAARPWGDRTTDILICGRMTEVKNPLFALRAAADAALVAGRRLRVHVVGSGELLEQMRAVAREMDARLDVRFSGFVQAQELPKVFGDSRILLFPTRWDPWGLVINEAAAAGVWTIASPHAGAVQELLVPGRYGEVLPLDSQLWAKRLSELVVTGAAARPRSTNLIDDFTFDAAANGLAKAIIAAAHEA